MQNATSALSVDRSLTSVSASGDSTPPSALYTSAGAISERSGSVFIGSGGALAMTLAAPSTDDNGKQLAIIASTAQAHTVTNAAPGFNSGGAASDVATFGGAIGDSMVVVAWGGVWHAVNLTNVTLA